MQNLERQGYAAYLPLMLVQRRDPVLRTVSRTVEAPLFGSYLFVVPGTHWAPIAHSRGVARLLMAGTQPGMVRAGLVERLQATEAARRGGVPDRGSWEAGDACNVPGWGDAVVLQIRKNSALVAMLMLGGVREVAVRLSQLRRRE